MTTNLIAVGDVLPTLDLTLPDGTLMTRNGTAGARATLVYFMRTSSCPVCHGHLRSIERTSVAGAPLSDRVLIVVPGTAKEATAVASRHPQLAGRVVASTTAHARVGLFSSAGIQRSGALVVDADNRVAQAHFGILPTSSFDLKAATTALASA